MEACWLQGGQRHYCSSKIPTMGGIVGVLDGVKIVCPYANVDLQLLRAFKMPCDSPQALRIMMSWRVQSQVPSRFGLTWVPKSFETSQVRAQMAPSPLTWRQDGPKLFELEPRWPLRPPSWSQDSPSISLFGIDMAPDLSIWSRSGCKLRQLGAMFAPKPEA